MKILVELKANYNEPPVTIAHKEVKEQDTFTLDPKLIYIKESGNRLNNDFVGTVEQGFYEIGYKVISASKHDVTGIIYESLVNMLYEDLFEIWTNRNKPFIILMELEYGMSYLTGEDTIKLDFIEEVDLEYI